MEYLHLELICRSNFVLVGMGASAIYRVYQNDWSDFEVHYTHKYGEQNYKY